MPQFKLNLPPGIDSNGTNLSRAGSWVDGSRIRWKSGVLQPIGGWGVFNTDEGDLSQVIADPSTEVARSFIAYKTNDGAGMYIAGTNKGLKAWYRGSAAVYDVTPPDFTPRPKSAASSSGYGMWFFSRDAYGNERQGEQLDLPDNFSWCMDTWGQNLLAAPRGAPSKLYEWSPNFSGKAAAVLNAPIDFDVFCVTDQRIVMVAGAPDSPRLVQWSTRENNTEWTPAVTNQAGSYVIPGTGRFKSMVGVQDKVLLVSESDAYEASYQGPPYVYGFSHVGNNCGTIAPNGVVSTEDFAIWPGRNSFFIYDGSVVSPLPCTVMDRFSKQINRTHLTKVYGFVNPGWPEIWWLYQEGEIEVDSYVYYNWAEKHWGIGKLDRTVGGGDSATGGLTMIGTDGFAYNHELVDVPPIDVSHDEVFVESGLFDGGGSPQYISYIIPDYKGEGIVAMSIIGQDRPNSASITFGPYLLRYPEAGGQPVAVRARGHFLKVRIEGRSGYWQQGESILEISSGSVGRKK